MVYAGTRDIEGSWEARELCNTLRIGLYHSVFQNVHELLSSMMKAKTLLNVEQHFLDFLDHVAIIRAKFSIGKKTIVQKFGKPSLSQELPIAKAISMKTQREDPEKEKAVRGKAKAEKEISKKHYLQIAFQSIASQMLSHEMEKWKKSANQREKQFFDQIKVLLKQLRECQKEIEKYEETEKLERQRYHIEMKDKSQQNEPEAHSIAESTSTKIRREESENKTSERHCLRSAVQSIKSEILSHEVDNWEKTAYEFEKQLMEKRRYRKQMEDKSQQTEPEPHSKIASKRRVIGIHGGEIELYGFKVSFPEKAVKEDIEFQLSVDNNYLHYPTGRGFPIAPIFGVSPSMAFNVPVDVKVQTWYSAAEGKQQSAQLLSKEDGEDWKEEKEVTVPDTNEVGFKVNHFCSKIIMVSKEDCRDGVYYFRSEAYIQRRTGTIISVFYRDPSARNDAAKEFEFSQYVKASPNYETISGPLNSVFEVKIDGITPGAVTYTGRMNTFKIGTGTADCGLVQIVQYLKDFTVLKSYEGPLILQQSIYLQKGGRWWWPKRDEASSQTLSVHWPPEPRTDTKQGKTSSTKEALPSISNTIVNSPHTTQTAHQQGDVNKSETNIAQNMATRDGQLSKEEHGNANTLNIGKQ